MDTIELFNSKDGWRFRIVARNGRILAPSGEAYASYWSMMRTVRAFMQRHSGFIVKEV